MAYHGPPPPPGYVPALGIKPTDEDRLLVKAWSVMGIGVREICRRLGVKFNLAKPMSRMSLYYHFRKELVPKKRGRRMGKKKLKRKVEQNIHAEMQKMIGEVRKQAAKVRDGEDEETD